MLNKIKALFLTCFQPPVWQIFTIVSTHSRLLAGVFCCSFVLASIVCVVLPSENKNVKRYNVNALSKIKNVTM